MPSPFPGMDPYLEEPEFWPGVHARLCVALADVLTPAVAPHYYVSVEMRVYEMSLAKSTTAAIGDVAITRERQPEVTSNGHQTHAVAVGSPGTAVLTVTLPRQIEVRERYLEIRRPGTHEVVTVIECLSPTNKRPGKGRQLYEEKRTEIASTRTNLVEIDLLRGGTPLPVLQEGEPVDPATLGDYRVLVSRGHRRHRGDLYVTSLRDPLPAIPIPLRPEDSEPEIALQSVLAGFYDRGRYDLALNYRDEPVPPLSTADAAWAAGLLRSHGLR